MLSRTSGPCQGKKVTRFELQGKMPIDRWNTGQAAYLLLVILSLCLVFSVYTELNTKYVRSV